MTLLADDQVETMRTRFVPSALPELVKVLAVQDALDEANRRWWELHTAAMEERRHPADLPIHVLGDRPPARPPESDQEAPAPGEG